jgi:2,4-dienoyl-CoA reductase-like NADH-dependent reductase (Old Yellow Enzyme family)
MHAGALSQANYYTTKTVAPSAVKPKGEQMAVYGGSGEYKVPQEMSKESIQEVIERFAAAAVRAREAGFDGVEVHGANGYLLDQFLTDYTNQRSDEYGGSTENRVRLLVEILEAVRRAVGSEFIVGIRISQGKVNDFTHKWAKGEEDAQVIFQRLATANPGYIHTTEYDATKPAFAEDGPTLAFLAKKYANLPVLANGKLGEESDEAENMLVRGEADLITLGKSALANPDWVKKVTEGIELETFHGDVLQPDASIKDKELL